MPENTIRQALMMHRLETDPRRSSWLAGYVRGVRRAHHGALFGSDSEHAFLTEIPEDDPEPTRAEYGRGYRAGFRGVPLQAAEDVL